MGTQAFDIKEFKTALLHGIGDHAESGKFSVRKDIAINESRKWCAPPICRARDTVIEKQPAWLQPFQYGLEIPPEIAHANVLSLIHI